MKHHKRSRIAERKHGARIAFLCALGCAGAARAQQILTPPPAVNTTPSAVQEMQNENGGTVSLAPLPLPALSDLLQWGPVSVRPHFDYQFSYSTGLQTAPGQSQDSIVNTISPGVLFAIGSHWTLDYTPTLTYYSSSQLENSVGHNVSLQGGFEYEDWVFGVAQNVAITTQPLVQTGADTSTSTYATALNASYRFNGSLSLDMSVSQNLYYVDQSADVPADEVFQNSETWSTMEYLNYQLWSRLTVGIGPGFEYDVVSGGPNMTAEQLQVRVQWRVTDKTSISVHGGAEDRQFLSGGLGSLISPVFGATIAYKPFEQTLFSLDAERTVAPSPLQSQITTTTTLAVGVTQRLLKKYTLNLNASYENSLYNAEQVGLNVNRTDNFYTLSARLQRQFWTRVTASAFYTYTRNGSTEDTFSFSSNQAGVELGYRF